VAGRLDDVGTVYWGFDEPHDESIMRFIIYCVLSDLR
jgi:hypothetical protein